MVQNPNVRAWFVTGKREISLMEFEREQCGPGRLRLRFVTNGRCGSDDHMFATGAVHPGHKGAHKPLRLGHELIATVDELGEGVTGFEVGDMVAVEPGIPCGTCNNCRRNRYHCCPKTLYMGTPPQDGGLADEFTWPAQWCHKLPDSLKADPVLASLAEPLAACRQAVVLRNEHTKREDEDWTVVTGSGAMALGVVAIIKANNPNEKVAVVARNARALEFAKQFGADEVFQLSDVDPKKVADEVTAALKDFFETDHFDSDENLEASFAASPALLAAAKAARDEVKRTRAAGGHQDDIESAIRNAAIKAAVQVQIQENKAVFQRVNQLAGGFVSSLFECTGDERLLETLIDARFMLANGVIIGLGCHYGVSFDIACLRRLELAFVPVRRSAHQFPPTLELLATQPELFRKLIGSTVTFEDFGAVMRGEKQANPTGTGGPKMVVVKSN